MTISRRATLTAFGASVVSFTRWPAALRACERAVPEFSFVVVSDTHLGRNDHDGPAEQWARTAREVDAAAGDFVLHLGDIVDGGREAQYAVYTEIRKMIRKPVYETLGNHDRQELFAKHVRRTVDLSFDHAGVRFLLLDNTRPDSHDGFVTAEQIDWLKEQCEGAATARLFVIVGMHVPAHENRHPDVGWYVKPDSGQKEFYAVMTRHRDRVLATFHGHFHCGLRGWEDHTPLQEVVFPSALYNADRHLTQQAAPGYALPEFQPGFALVTIGSEGMTLRYKPVGGAGTHDKICALNQFSE